MSGRRRMSNALPDRAADHAQARAESPRGGGFIACFHRERRSRAVAHALRKRTRMKATLLFLTNGIHPLLWGAAASIAMVAGTGCGGGDADAASGSGGGSSTSGAGASHATSSGAGGCVGTDTDPNN